MEFKNTQVWGFEGALRGARNPMNSWDKSDTGWYEDTDSNEHLCEHMYYDIDTDNVSFKAIGPNDLKLSRALLKGGPEEYKFLRMIHVQVDVDMPRYWWSEADTYHFGTKNSCSTMHRLLNNINPITKDLFVFCEEDEDIIEWVIERLETLRKQFKEIQATTKDNEKMNYLLLRAKRILPEGFLQMRTWDTNYAEIRNMYHQRKHHRLKEEWIDTFCKWAESLPYADVYIIN